MRPLPRPAHERPGAARDLDVASDRGWLLDASRDQTLALLQQVDVALAGRQERVVTFLAAGRGAGTSSVAWAYARAAALVLGRRVLLLDASGGASRGATAGLHSLTRTPSLVDVLADGEGLGRVIVPVSEGFFTASLA